MTPIIFGSTVGYPSDSLASCFYTSRQHSLALGHACAFYRKSKVS